MAKLSQYRIVTLLALLLVAIGAGVVWLNQRELSIAYHRRAMNSAYDEMFGDPEPVGNGLASYDVTGVDIDAVMARYTHHRQRLVELGYFCYLRKAFPDLSTPSDQNRRSDFVQRMWVQFPQHKHYYLSPVGTLEVWDVLENKTKWKAFFDSER